MTTGTAPITDVGPSSGALLKRLLLRGTAAASLLVVILIIACCLLAPVLIPAGPNVGDLTQSLRPPSGAHLLGTDSLGRDVLARLLYGGRPSLLYAGVVAIVALAIGIPLGMLAGYRGGWIDRWVMGATDVGLATPVMIVVIVVLSVLHDYFLVAMVALGILLVPAIVRSVRAPVLALRHELFIDAAVIAGLPTRRILFRHVLPRISGPVLVQVALVSAMSIQFTVGLAFLGFGPPPPDPTWGSIIADGSRTLNNAPWILLSAGALVAVMILALGLLGDSIRDVSVEAWAGAPARRTLRRPAPASARTSIETSNPTALLSVRGLSIGVGPADGAQPIVSDVDLDVFAGETVGLVGESGCGKSSVARAIVRLLRSGAHIERGHVVFDGTDVLALTGRALSDFRGGSIAYLPQEPMSALDPTFRVGAQLCGAITAHEKMSKRQARARAVELLESVQLPNARRVMDLYAHELSGGMAQRVAIARAIAGNPRLLIADEPTTALDVTVQAGILRLLRSLQKDRGLAILLVSHDWGAVAELCDRSLVMYAGELVEEGSTDDILERAAHPYTAALLTCRPSETTDPAQPLPVISGTVPKIGTWPSHCRFADRCSLCIPECLEGAIPFTPVEDGRAARCILADSLLEVVSENRR